MMNSSAKIQTVEFDGKRFVIMPEADYWQMAALPPANEAGNRPAVAAMRAILARDIVRDRERVGWTQAELARQAGIRGETLNRIETGKHSPSVATIQKIDIALQRATKGKKRRSS